MVDFDISNLKLDGLKGNKPQISSSGFKIDEKAKLDSDIQACFRSGTSDISEEMGLSLSSSSKTKCSQSRTSEKTKQDLFAGVSELIKGLEREVDKEIKTKEERDAKNLKSQYKYEFSEEHPTDKLGRKGTGFVTTVRDKNGEILYTQHTTSPAGFDKDGNVYNHTEYRDKDGNVIEEVYTDGDGNVLKRGLSGKASDEYKKLRDAEQTMQKVGKRTTNKLIAKAKAKT